MEKHSIDQSGQPTISPEEVEGFIRRRDEAIEDGIEEDLDAIAKELESDPVLRCAVDAIAAQATAATVGKYLEAHGAISDGFSGMTAGTPRGSGYGRYHSPRT